MSCLVPMWLPETSERFGTYVPCGKCVGCLEDRRAVWTFRINQENKNALSSYFVTLTYDPEHIPLIDQWEFTVGSLDKSDLQKFMKKLRQKVIRYTSDADTWLKVSKSGKKVPLLRYFAVGEYGKLGDRPHYHILLFNLPTEFVDYDPIHEKMYSQLLDEVWDKGIVDVGKVENASIHYVAKYTLDKFVQEWLDCDNRQRTFSLMSRRPGIGLNYVTDEIKDHYSRAKVGYTIAPNNVKLPIGRYYKDQIFENNRKARLELNRKAREYSDKQREAEFEATRKSEDDYEAQLDYNKLKAEQKREKERKVINRLKRNVL